jgi:hypothetical protein
MTFNAVFGAKDMQMTPVSQVCLRYDGNEDVKKFINCAFYCLFDIVNGISKLSIVDQLHIMILVRHIILARLASD